MKVSQGKVMTIVQGDSVNTWNRCSTVTTRVSLMKIYWSLTLWEGHTRRTKKRLEGVAEAAQCRRIKRWVALIIQVFRGFPTRPKTNSGTNFNRKFKVRWSDIWTRFRRFKHRKNYLRVRKVSRLKRGNFSSRRSPKKDRVSKECPSDSQWAARGLQSSPILKMRQLLTSERTWNTCKIVRKSSMTSIMSRHLGEEGCLWWLINFSSSREKAAKTSSQSTLKPCKNPFTWVRAPSTCLKTSPIRVTLSILQR